MVNILFWLYLTNAILLINHEIDSAYWKEWKLFKLKIGITGFLLIHFLILFLVLYGLILVFQQTFSGFIFSLLLSFACIFAFFVHMYFIKKGKNEFNTPISKFILISGLILSIAQIVYMIITFVLIINLIK